MNISDTGGGGAISQTKIYVLVIWLSSLQRLANMAVIIMGSVHGTCQRVNATPLMIDWIFSIGVVKNSRKYICELVSWK